MNGKIIALAAALASLAACTKAPPGPGAATSTSVTSSSIVPGSEEDLRTNVGDRVYFDFNQYTITGTSERTRGNYAVLGRQVTWLQRYSQNNVQIAGNCDERGTEEYNLALGQRRANSMRDFLVAKGITPSRMTAISFGSERPTATASNEDAWAQNRNAIMSLR